MDNPSTFLSARISTFSDNRMNKPSNSGSDVLARHLHLMRTPTTPGARRSDPGHPEVRYSRITSIEQ
jgi:hypothetical protein